MNIGTVIGGAFRVIRDRPIALAVWSLLYLLVSAAMTLAMRPELGVQVAGRAGLIGLILLLDAIYFVVMVIVLTAVQRAILHPERNRFFYLRLGMDELRALLLFLLLGVGAYILLVVAIVVPLLIAGGIGLGSTMAVAVVTMVVVGAFLVWLEVRLSLSFPLTVMRGRLVIGESWRLTRGRFWPLFGTYFVVLLMLMAMWGVVTALTLNSFVGDLSRYGFTPQGMNAASANEAARQLEGISPTMVLALAVGSVVATVGLAIWGGTLATAAEELTLDIDKIAETFA